MESDRLVKIIIENAEKVTQGVYSGLFCSKCENESVEAFFSEHHSKKRYGIWFECQLCRNVEHINCKFKPEGFTVSRLSDKFQAQDENAWGAE
ncbi:MAG: hypothetical protein KA403_05190 [Candidatus Omnitrophica bacterium]|nr:hypothetical protein [Candidatus Omnitrophota bacterium]